MIERIDHALGPRFVYDGICVGGPQDTHRMVQSVRRFSVYADAKRGIVRGSYAWTDTGPQKYWKWEDAK